MGSQTAEYVQEQRFCLRIETAILRTKALRGVYPPCRRRRTAGGFTPPLSYGGGGLPPTSSSYKGGVYPLQCRRVSVHPSACLSFSYFLDVTYASQLYVVAPDCPRSTPPTSSSYVGGGLPPPVVHRRRPAPVNPPHVIVHRRRNSGGGNPPLALLPYIFESLSL